MAAPQAVLSTRLIFLKVGELQYCCGVVSRANCSVNGMTGIRARMISPMMPEKAGASQVASQWSVPALEAKPTIVRMTSRISWEPVRIIGGQTGRCATMAMTATTAEISAATPKSWDGSRRASSEKATRGRNPRMSGSGFIPWNLRARDPAKHPPFS